MILRVTAVSGHYGIPGPTTPGVGEMLTYPIAPPSTIRGFLESFCGKPYGTFKDIDFAYGYCSQPGGFGLLFQKRSVWSSSGVKIPSATAKSGLKNTKETKRPIRVATYFDMDYWIEIQGLDEVLEQALAGTIEREEGGPLFLGESSDLVSSIEVLKSRPTKGTHLVPGTQIIMPWISGRKFASRDAILKGWDLVDLASGPVAT